MDPQQLYTAAVHDAYRHFGFDVEQADGLLVKLQEPNSLITPVSVQIDIDSASGQVPFYFLVKLQKGKTSGNVSERETFCDCAPKRSCQASRVYSPGGTLLRVKEPSSPLSAKLG